MGKSKFQAKAQVKVGVKTTVKKSKSKYYDEHIKTTDSSKSNSNFVVFIIVCIIIGASVSGVIIANNNEDPDPDGTSGGIQEGDTIRLKYEFYLDDNHDGEFSNSEFVIQEEVVWKVEENSEAYPPGFYYNILGMKVGQTKNFIIPANVDLNPIDGIDDITGIPVWEGEYNLGQYNLRYYIEILNIN